MSSETAEQLPERGRRAGLISAATAQDLVAQLTGDRRLSADEAAARMLEQKVLTPYQAEQLLAGRDCAEVAESRPIGLRGQDGLH